MFAYRSPRSWQCPAASRTSTRKVLELNHLDRSSCGRRGYDSRRHSKCRPRARLDMRFSVEVFVIESAILRFRFGRRVRALLKKTGLMPADLAARCKLPEKRVIRILNGTYVRLTIGDMDVIAKVLETPLYTLLAPSALLDSESGHVDRSEG